MLNDLPIILRKIYKSIIHFVIYLILSLLFILKGYGQTYDYNNDCDRLSLLPVNSSKWKIIVEGELKESYSHNWREFLTTYRSKGGFSEKVYFETIISLDSLIPLEDFPISPDLENIYSPAYQGVTQFEGNINQTEDASEYSENSLFGHYSNNCEAFNSNRNYNFNAGYCFYGFWGYNFLFINSDENAFDALNYSVSCQTVDKNMCGTETENHDKTRNHIDDLLLGSFAIPLQPGKYINSKEETSDDKSVYLNESITMIPLCEITWIHPPSQEILFCDNINQQYIYPEGPDGATNYHWTIVQGEDKIEITNAANTKNPEIRLISFSEYPNDVIVNLSYHLMGENENCSASFSVLKPGDLLEIGNNLPIVSPSSLRLERQYQVLSQFGITYPLNVNNMEVTEKLSSIDVNGNSVTWFSGESRRLSFNPNLPQYIGEGVPAYNMIAQSTQTDNNGCFFDTPHISFSDGSPLPTDMDIVVHQEIFVNDCLVGIYQIHFTHNQITVE